jgi:hypothetical protein
MQRLTECSTQQLFAQEDTLIVTAGFDPQEVRQLLTLHLSDLARISMVNLRGVATQPH